MEKKLDLVELTRSDSSKIAKYYIIDQACFDYVKVKCGKIISLTKSTV